jgi:hypothetical protein
MNGSRRMFLGVLIAALTLTVFGCFTTSQLNSENFTGQGGGTTSATSTATTTTTTTAATSSSTGGGVPCMSTSTCDDDGNVCTAEVCANGFCAHAPLNLVVGPGSKECMAFKCEDGVAIPTSHEGDPCGTGLKCVGNVCTGCVVDTDCGDTNTCKTSVCNKSDQTCTYTFAPIGTMVSDPTSGDCMIMACNGAGATVPYPDDADLPNDKNQCKDGTCINGTPGEKSSAIGTPCMAMGTYCNMVGACVSCTINAGCNKAGEHCFAETKCVSCTNSKMDGDETDIDCGGSCGKCADKLTCLAPSDCISGICSMGKCASCNDKMQDGDETDVDCGGATCLACTGSTCVVSSDCLLGHCNNTVCCGVDCVGPCKSCNLPMKAGMCLDSPLGFADSACPAATPVCKTGVCVDANGGKALGAPCSMPSECFSNICMGPSGNKTCK